MTHSWNYKIWNALKTAFTSTLDTNKGLGNYNKLQITFSARDVLVSSLGHTQRNQAMSVDEKYNRGLRKIFFKEGDCQQSNKSKDV